MDELAVNQGDGPPVDPAPSTDPAKPPEVAQVSEVGEPAGPATSAAAEPAAAIAEPEEPEDPAETDERVWRVWWGRHGLRALAVVAALLTLSGGLSIGLTTWIARRAGTVTASPAPTRSTTADRAAPDPSGSLARVVAVQPLLDRRAAAVRRGQRADWAATLDPTASASAFRTQQLAEFDRIRRLPVRSWRYELIETAPVTGGTASPGEFTARVRLSYRLAGDTRDVERVFAYTVARRGAGWVLAGSRREEGDADPWELGPLTVVTARRGMVIGIGRAPAGIGLARTAHELDVAASRVDAIWGSGWRRDVVVIVPPDAARTAALLGKDGKDQTGHLDQVAAITTGELAADRAGGGGGAADRVVLNPAAFARLSQLGRRVVLTHELTHVATRGTTRASVPLWVEEGFANYVAYSGSGLAPSVIAEDVLPLVRAGTASSRLPDQEAFDPVRGPIAPAYADAWLAFDLMSRDGAGRPLAFYRVAAGLPARSSGGSSSGAASSGAASSGAASSGAASSADGEALARAFREVLGTDASSFEARWRAHRAALVTGGRAR